MKPENTMPHLYHIEQYHRYVTSTKTGVSPRRVCYWRIIRNADGRCMESAIETRKAAERIMRFIP